MQKRQMLQVRWWLSLTPVLVLTWEEGLGLEPVLRV